MAQYRTFGAFVQQKQQNQNANSCCNLEEGLLEGTFRSILMLCHGFGAGSGAMRRQAVLEGCLAEQLQGPLVHSSELFTMNEASDEFGLILPLGNVLKQTTISSKTSHVAISFCDSK